MKIVSAYDLEAHRELTTEQIQADMPELLKAHKKALNSEPTWNFFGGILTLGEHEYQVC
jgi:hypothetical protein